MDFEGLAAKEYESMQEKVDDLEVIIEGLGQQNTELESEIEHHETRYRSAIKMIQSRESQLQLEKGARVRLAKNYTAIRQGLDKLLPSVEDLKNVNTNDLDDAIDQVVGALAKLLEAR